MTLTWICRVVFFPVWVFHAVVARGRFSLPAPSIPYDRHVWLYAVTFLNFDKKKEVCPNKITNQISLLLLYSIYCGCCLHVDSGLHVMLLLRHLCLLHLNYFSVYISRAYMVRKKNSTIVCDMIPTSFLFLGFMLLIHGASRSLLVC